MQERLHRIDRLDAVGRLAAGVAHDVHNVLTVILGEVDYLLEGGDLPEEISETLEVIRASGQRGAELTGRLMDLSREKEPRFVALELNAIIEGFGSMLERLVGASCQVDLDLCPEPTTVQADPGMLEQVLMNLVINARDAMPGDGTLTVTTRPSMVDEETASRHPDAHAGRYVRLSVSDTGAGIAIEDQARIFEPLFTTKGEGKGTGLGLATVHSIVQEHGGWLDLESEPGSGAIFHVYLPAVTNDGQNDDLCRGTRRLRS